MIAVSGGKGGCGKTTTTLGLANALADDRPTSESVDRSTHESASRTLTVDADRDMPNLHAVAGVPREPTLADVVDGDAAVPYSGEVGVLPAPTDSRSSPALRRYLETLRRRDGPVLVDCPAGAGPDAVTPLRAADGVVLAATPRPDDLRDATKTAAMARELGTPIHGLVLTRTPEQSVGRPTRAGIDRLLDAPVLCAVPKRPPPVLDREAVRRSYATAVRRLSDVDTVDVPSRRSTGVN